MHIASGTSHHQQMQPETNMTRSFKAICECDLQKGDQKFLGDFYTFSFSLSLIESFGENPFQAKLEHFEKFSTQFKTQNEIDFNVNWCKLVQNGQLIINPLDISMWVYGLLKDFLFNNHPCPFQVRITISKVNLTECCIQDFSLSMKISNFRNMRFSYNHLYDIFQKSKFFPKLALPIQSGNIILCPFERSFNI